MSHNHLHPIKTENDNLDTPHSPIVYDYSPNTGTSNSDSDSEDNLPYPLPLSRKDFLTTPFNPQTYLSTTLGPRTRHQTLEDLRSDLRQRSQLLNQELLDLVNGNYEEFLTLGRDLKGGEEKVEGVRVGLLGFEREVEGIEGVVRERMREVGGLVEERREVRRDIVMGRGLVEVGVGIEMLEGRMGVGDTDAERDEDLEDSDDDEDDEDAESDSVVKVGRLRKHTQQYILLSRSITRLGSDHPFLQAQQPRMAEIRRTLLLDLGAALKQAKVAKAEDAILAIVRLYADLGAQQEGVKALKGG